jgi:small subunit ribosomal protein S20
MANHKSSEKMIRKIVTRTARNKARKSRVHTFWVRVDKALHAGDAAQARAAFRDAESEMAHAASKGVLHPNTVARKVSRMAHRVKRLEAAAS